MPTLTAANALIRAADNLTKALAGVIPPPNMTTDAINQLINIFKMQVEKEKDKVPVCVCVCVFLASGSEVGFCKA